ncbi:hypothetical protein MVES1_002515 [Malassezia vespertilionis]|uniref:Transcription factor CBF/NF-Y/archaeal histone domain-containing protein n=1 Tax=Malassezia vespertilionis TaxID=2020962 RepID=A0A2N1JB34_9BASI|nr:uncharacterized protein MVES1_002515 [Malassezia vespertilionis]PKI83759.1 hypothetical protein MVES_002373 [Malassezia vespertilionis]WFD07157.1 hypothetical protein MVES1_002515 [Malassezia vespertilionis]
MVRRGVASKFPIARIKRIMQADEDVGKVAQATPVVISKALELFMQNIVESAVGQTRKSGGKRVAPYHLKRAVQANETFDFLKDIVDKVVDPLENGGTSTRKRRKVAKAEPAEEPEPETKEETPPSPSAETQEAAPKKEEE